MKKWMVLLGIMMFTLLSACQKDTKEDPVVDTEEETVVKLISPAGGPSLAIIQMIDSIEELEGVKIEYTVVKDAPDLAAAMQTKSHEIVIAPSNVGALLYNKGAGYLYGGTVSFGNLYLVGTVDTPLSDLNEHDLVAFGNGATPGILLTEILKDQGVYQADKIQFETAVSDAQIQLISGNYDYALLAEPVLSATRMKMKKDLNKDLYVIADIQALYQEMTGEANYPQAGIFIHQDFYRDHQAFVQAFLTKVEASTNFVNDSKDDAAAAYHQAFVDGIIPVDLPIPVLKNAIPGSNISFLNASDSKAIMTPYLQFILDSQPKLVGGKLPDDAFYLGE
jgi:NitT/TauT family transport system substrate-binding protein